MIATLVLSADLLGAAGESCRTENDCKLGLRCVELTCTDPKSTTKPTSTSSSSSESAPSGSGAPSEWMTFDLGNGIHPFVGAAWMGGPAYGGLVGGRFDTGISGSFLAAIRGGVYIDGKHEIQVELSPFTYAFYHPIQGPQFQVNATYGFLIPLVRKSTISMYWPLRAGIGTFFGNIGGDVYFQARADLVGFAIRIGHLMIDFHLPSYRFAVTSVRGLTPVVFSWEIGAGVAYAF